MDDQNYIEDDDIIILKSSAGEDLEFTEIKRIAYKGKTYAILKPNFELDGKKDDEAMVFESTSMPDGSIQFNTVLNDEIVAAIFNEYYKLIDDSDNK